MTTLLSHELTHAEIDMKSRRLQIGEGMRKLLDYPKFAGATRVLILETGYFFDQIWARTARSLGWEAQSVSSAMVGGLTHEQLASLFKTLAEFKPDFILTSNFSGMDTLGIFGRFFEDVRIPYVSWFTDPPHMILYGRDLYLSDYVVAATWERAYLPQYQRLGFKHVHFMPHAADPAMFSGAPEIHTERALAFVGTSMIEQTREAFEKHEHLPHVVAAMQQAFDAGRINRHNYNLGLEAMLDPEIIAPLDASERRNLELLINYEATRRQRLELVQALAPLGVLVRGDENWRSVYAKVGGPVDFFRDLAGFYRGTAVNVNNTSLQMECAVNQRVFDCPAAGGFLLSDAQPDMEQFFDLGKEAIVYHSLDEAHDLAAWYTDHPEERLAITEAARRRIQAEHQHAHRLTALENFLKERYA
jgi:spore maturation protein CgeB